jgi:predicted PurR-regulated permease PerM
MVLVGVLSYAGLRIVGVEYAAALALISGALTFIPFLGPLVSGGIAILVALPQGLDIAPTATPTRSSCGSPTSRTARG